MSGEGGVGGGWCLWFPPTYEHKNPSHTTIKQNTTHIASSPTSPAPCNSIWGPSSPWSCSSWRWPSRSPPSRSSSSSSSWTSGVRERAKTLCVDGFGICVQTCRYICVLHAAFCYSPYPPSTLQSPTYLPTITASTTFTVEPGGTDTLAGHPPRDPKVGRLLQRFGGTVMCVGALHFHTYASGYSTNQPPTNPHQPPTVHTTPHTRRPPSSTAIC